MRGWATGSPTPRFAGGAAEVGGGPSGPGVGTGGGSHRCCECDRTFPEADLVAFEGRWVCAGCKSALFQRIREGAVLPGDMVYGGFWIRLGAKLIDNLILSAGAVVILGIAFGIGFAVYAPRMRAAGAEDAIVRLFEPPVGLLLQLGMQLVFNGVAILYNTLFTGRYGATPGKMACGLRVVTADGGKVTYGRALGRAFGEILSGMICSIGYIIAAFDSEKRALHDHICSTRVIVRPTAR